MAYTVTPHPTMPRHYYVDNQLVAGARDSADAVRIYEEAQAERD